MQYLQLSHNCQVRHAHFGYIYDLELVSLGPDRPYVLISGSGDEDVKLWELQPPSPLRPCGGMIHLATLHNSEAGVLALASWQSTLFAGHQGGQIDVWDLETFTVLRTLKAGEDDVLSLSALRGPDGKGSALFTACADGTLKRFDARFRCIAQWKGHQGVVLSSAVSIGHVAQNADAHDARRQREVKLLSGGSDSLLKVWSCSTTGVGGSVSQRAAASAHSSASLAAHALLGTSLDSAPSTPTGSYWGAETPNRSSTDFKALSTEQSDALLVRTLSEFVSFQSVSAEATREQCRQCSLWLKSCLTELGAEARILAGADKRNPLILATFRGRSNLQDMSSGGQRAKRRRKRCLFYGHYDCIGADGSKWKSDPWTISGRDGYLYGRGVSDNKGPVLAIAFAASQLLSRRELEIDLVMLIEGEEERGSVGFQQALVQAKEEIGPIDVVLLSNSYWLGEDTPCLTVGLRGVVQVTVKITGRIPDVHSGVEGGAVREPMVDMVRLLSNATAGDRVLVPHFYDSVKQVSPEERKLYEAIVKMKQSRARNAEDLIARWRLPTLSIHRINVSGPGNSTVIPSTVEASISIRIVPDQSLQTITSSLVNHLITSFKQLSSSNELSVTVDHSADWWAGKQDSPFALALSDAIEAEWGTKPVNICEGGSIPAVAILEQALGAEAVHIPLGQSTDNAHLNDERIRLLNLHKGKAVISRFFKALPNL